MIKMINQLNLNSRNMKNKLNELNRRLLFVIGSLIIFRIGSFIPIPGINTVILAKLIEQQRSTIIEMFNMFSGAAFSRASIFALGIMPYISSFIIIQLLTVIHPKMKELKKEGESGRRKINNYTRYGTLVLSIFQSIGIATSLPNIPGMYGLVMNPDFSFYFIAVISLVTGTIFLMWLSEQITERGIGNGTSIIIFTGIVAGLPPAVIRTFEKVYYGNAHFFLLLLCSVLVFTVIFFVVFFERGQRRIIVNYAKRQQGRRIYIAQNTHLPLKMNMVGVIPAIFASSIILFLATIASYFSKGSISWNWLTEILLCLQPGKSLYILLYASAIVFFCFFYTALIFNPRETADNLKKSGAFVPGIRPGEQTARYINKIMNHLTLVGSIYITFICLIPEFMRDSINIPFCFGGTSLLIVVVVIMDFMAQVQTIMMSSQYESVLKKANLKGYSY